MTKQEFIERNNPFEYTDGDGESDKLLRQFHEEFNADLDDVIKSEIEAYKAELIKKITAIKLIKP
jgi:hypothetical protein